MSKAASDLKHASSAASRSAAALDPAAPGAPAARFLSNGRLVTLLTAAGTGYASLESQALTRWSGDRVEDRDGSFLYLRDLVTGAFWSLGYQPAHQEPEHYQARWRPGTLRIERRDQGVEALLEACVAPEEMVEVRRVTLRNLSARERRLELTTYAEVVLQQRAADASHPAFSKLFVQTEWVPRLEALLARRRARSPEARHPWLAHALLGAGAIQHESDRARFLGRGRGPAAPLALEQTAPLSSTTGDVLDPILALRRTVTLRPGEAVGFAALLAAAPDRDAAVALLERCGEPGWVDHAFAGAATAEAARLRRLGLSARDAERYQALAGALVYGHPALRAAPDVVARAEGRPAEVGRWGLSPAGLAVIDAQGPDAAAVALDAARAHRYWRALGLPLDLVLLCDDPAALPADSLPRGDDRHQVLRRAEVSPRERDLLLAVARLVARQPLPDPTRPAATQLDPRPSLTTPHLGPDAAPDRPLRFFNGFGGFTEEGDEYVISLERDRGSGLRRPPAPWINVVANPRFGFTVSEVGAGCTWSRNSREHRLTPWSNDSTRDPHGEALYLRDEETGAFWSPLPGPAPPRAACEARHGFGYSLFRQTSQGLGQESCVFAARGERVKLVRLRLAERSGRPRRLSLFAYQRLVLGVLPEEAGRFVVTAHDVSADMLFARNRLAGDFADGVTFAAAVVPAGTRAVHCCADREGYIGRNGSPACPAAVARGGALDGRVGAGLDPCFAQQVVLDLAAGGSSECVFLLGEADDEHEARTLVARLRAPGAVERELEAVRSSWREVLSAVRIETPEPALDLMANGWLAYQDLSCRVWGRSAFYQSGGAFGYRDQLQDAAALLYLRPDLTRAQILLHAAHQFVEGDVLHWWHPPRARGLRTRFADDLLWLPWAAAGYVRATGDWSLLEERARYLAARPLAPGEDEAFLEPADSGLEADVYDHCCRALDRSLVVGERGLPLFGTGDWNDGMNRVGREGKGESVWMGFFLVHVLGEFLPLCERRRDHARARRYRAHAERLTRALNEAAWDGDWYRRGYYDDGTPLGSRASDECQIDALAQAWAVISGVAPPERAGQAMDAVERHLVQEKDGLIRLLTPPFENTPHDPGYIKGYVPGVRENGGQYTHAALWVVRALAELGRCDRAARLLAMLSPVSHAVTAEQAERYKVEPYVIAADVYGTPPHVGRGGWTWYTGSAGWMLRVTLETLLGFRLSDGDTLVLRPRIPDEWPGFTLRWRVPGEATRYEIVAANPRRCARGVTSARADGAPVPIEGAAAHVPLARDGRAHRVDLELG